LHPKYNSHKQRDAQRPEQLGWTGADQNVYDGNTNERSRRMAIKQASTYRLSDSTRGSITWIAGQLGLSEAAVIELAILKLRRDGIPGFLQPTNPEVDLAKYLALPPLPEPPLHRAGPGRPPKSQAKAGDGPEKKRRGSSR
jgi:hypothetical protein